MNIVEVVESGCGLTLYYGDCLNAMNYLEDNSIDMVLCDPPQGITQNGWDVPLPLDELWHQYHRLVKKNGAIVLFSNGMFTAKLMQSNPNMWRYNLIWAKTTPTGFLNANRMPLRAHEDICVFYRKLPTYNPQKSTGHPPANRSTGVSNGSNYGASTIASKLYGGNTDRYPTSILKYPTDKQRCHLHPTQKPVALLENLICTYTNPGDTVLDNCMGSGSTGVACGHSGRRFIGIEIEHTHFCTARDRLLCSTTNRS